MGFCSALLLVIRGGVDGDDVVVGIIVGNFVVVVAAVAVAVAVVVVAVVVVAVVVVAVVVATAVIAVGGVGLAFDVGVLMVMIITMKGKR